MQKKYPTLFAQKGNNFEDEILLRGGSCETPVVLKYDFYVKIMDFRVIFIPNNSKIPNWEFEKP